MDRPTETPCPACQSLDCVCEAKRLIREIRKTLKVRMPRFGSFMDASYWVHFTFGYNDPRARRCTGNHCDLDRPCPKHRAFMDVAAGLWKRQGRKQMELRKGACNEH